MTLGEIYDLLLKEGVNQDRRGRRLVFQYLRKINKKYRSLKGRDKRNFDKELLKNPYADTRILYGDRKRKVKTALVGIDIDVAEILLADRLKKNKKIDFVVSHHPSGRAYANFYEVMDLQIDLLNQAGVARPVAEDLLIKRKKEVERKVISANHTRAVDAARLLDIPFLCAHTVADNCVASYLQNLMDKRKPKKLADVLKILDAVPEYKIAAQNNVAPRILIGEENKPAGKIMVEMTGGTEGSKQAYSRLSQAGVNTLVCMHVSEEAYKVAKEQYINIIVAGHISSDTLGLNLLLDKLEKKGKIDFISCSGFQRIKRR